MDALHSLRGAQDRLNSIGRTVQCMSEEIPEPVEQTPWRPEDGPRPKVWTWPRTDRPALYV